MSLNKKIREGELAKIPYLLICGNREKEEGKVAVRKYGAGDQGAIPAEVFLGEAEKQNVSPDLAL